MSTQYINHPAPALAYRIEADGVIVVYMCDHEPYGEKLWREDAMPGRLDSILHDRDRRHATFMWHADLVIHDAQYTPEEYPLKKNWGHSSFEYPVELAAMSDVHRLVLTHHDPMHNDEFIDEIQRRARHLARQRNFMMHVMCAYEGLEVLVAEPKVDRARGIDIAVSIPQSTTKTHVLIVDDDPNLRLIAVAALQRAGFATSEAADGEEGLQAFSNTGADIVILDLNMPRLNGIETLKRLRLDHTRVPVLVLTAQGDESNTAAAFAAGATDYLVKPFSTPQLCARLRACLAHSQALGAAVV